MEKIERALNDIAEEAWHDRLQLEAALKLLEELRRSAEALYNYAPKASEINENVLVQLRDALNHANTFVQLHDTLTSKDK